jgi:DNA helicase-2/ATP-dependent DNA helicase PcrA
MNLNAEQNHVVSSPAEKICVLAAAGAGKTACLTERITRIVEDGAFPSAILVLTFTNAGANEMRERFRKRNPEKESPLFCTFHAFCYKLIATDHNVLNAIGYSEIPQIADDTAIKRIETTCKQQLGTKLTKGKLNGTEPLTTKDRFEYNLYHKLYRKMLKQSGLITFDILCNDVCSLFVNDDDVVVKYKSTFKFVFGDEWQDSDKLQHNFLLSFTNSNLFVVGDTSQCQPRGTMITMIDGSKKLIEDIQVGDMVLSYDQRNGYFPKSLQYGKKVVQTSSRMCESLIEIKADDKITRYTPEHITYAKIHYTGNENKHVVYIMRNEHGWFRVGSTRLFLKTPKEGGSFGCRYRMQCEDAESVWILDVVDTAQEAWLIEQISAYRFGIPQTTWTTLSNIKSTAEYERLYSEIGDIEAKAETCLKFYGRDINYPLFNKYDNKHFSKLHIFQINACNLTKGIMDVAIPYKDENSRWKLNYALITSINTVNQPTEVISLEVETLHNYVADDILTHNCIYQFRGTTNALMKSLTEDVSWVTKQLRKSY